MPQHNQLTTEMTLQGGMERLYAQIQAREVYQDAITWLALAFSDTAYIYWGPSQIGGGISPDFRKASISLRIIAHAVVDFIRTVDPTITLPGVTFDMNNLNDIADALAPQYVFHDPTVALVGTAQTGAFRIPANMDFRTEWFKPNDNTDYLWAFTNPAGQGDMVLSVEVTVRLN